MPFLFSKQLVAGLAAVLFTSTTPLLAQSLQPPRIQTDGAVYTTVRDGNVLYVGGSFTTAGYYTGYGSLLSTSSHMPNTDFPITDGEIYASVPDGAGGWYIGGWFSKVGTVSRSYVAHVLSDHTVDPAFNPAADGIVRALCLSGATLYIGGDFNQVGGVARGHLASVNATTGVVNAFNPNPNATVYALSVVGSSLYVGGDFDVIGNQRRRHLAAVDAASGSLINYPVTNGTVRAFQADGTASLS